MTNLRKGSKAARQENTKERSSAIEKILKKKKKKKYSSKPKKPEYEECESLRSYIHFMEEVISLTASEAEPSDSILPAIRKIGKYVAFCYEA